MRENKRKLIINVAMKEFAKRGFEGASLDDIAKTVGVTKAAIYYHFKDKAALYEVVLLKMLQKLAQRIEDEVEKREGAEQKLECYIITFGSFLHAHPHLAPILAHEFADNGKHMSEVASKSLSKTLNILTSILNEGIRKKVFEMENPMLIQLMIVSSLIMHQTTMDLRRRVASLIDEYEVLPEPTIDDLSKRLAQTIIKAMKET